MNSGMRYLKGVKMFRYEVPVDGQVHEIELSGEVVFTAARKRDVVEFWAFHGAQPPQARRFQVFGTGHPLPDVLAVFHGSALDGPLVWHLFELVDP